MSIWQKKGFQWWYLNSVMQNRVCDNNDIKMRIHVIRIIINYLFSFMFILCFWFVHTPMQCSASLCFTLSIKRWFYEYIFLNFFRPSVWFSSCLRIPSSEISDIFHKRNCSFHHIIIITFVNGHASESSGSSIIKHSHDYSFFQFCNGVRRWRA